ncbi:MULTISPECIES: (2,3-dihydroxybenzoyl)adenylate synthase [Pseudonocardia]|uniref:2,3-dihydroxybenzoate-AMP ligase n=2 Tax=Pseudonocardia TaxID=1847 RepID=A0A1Y2N1S6_PSEAH|nr:MULTISPECIES: AMP-binding protein [Pseudonocardia]OSY40838.1 2,3-dihydroxybenzoate-AMP ligase [Pseudonocardia autotrophica]TDN71854.1 2,3-dihydroxybenzoate-AMP ligase [Pseudonocardia autotrophica]BBG02542.1 2,3-dihydroxybenzoate-AMP ligase [Pseudonocardia autotrophica]GEC29305.1 2,3-dihydroxybenzoate-AMP ligase [Pseudonocardia saturnea]
MLDGFVPWPDDLAHRYRERGWWAGRTLGAELRGWARRSGDRTALVAGPERWSYRDLDHRADAVSARLAAAGITRGDVVVLQLDNTASFVAVIFGLFRLGARPVVALPAHRRSEIEYFCTATGATACLVPEPGDGFDHRALAEEVREVVPTLRTVLVVGGPAPGVLDVGPARPGEPAPPAEIDDPSDVALLLLSGGTTGLPKLVPRTHDDWSYSGRAMAETIPYDASTVTLVGLPIGHNWTLTHGMLATFHAGGTLVVAPSPDPEQAFGLVERERVTDTGLVPGMAMLWMSEAEWTPHDLSSLRRVAIGGTKLAEEVARAVEPALGCRLQQMFGMAEGLVGFVRDDDPDEMRVLSQGRPISDGDELRVVDDTDRDVPPGEPGELLTRGPYTIRGYFDAPEHDVRAFTRDGYYRTGDLVRVLPGGFVVFEGRVKDQINRGGEKIAAEEVENHLHAHPAVRDVLVVGVPDRVLGERCCACVVPEGPPPTLAGIREFLTGRGLAAYKFPDLLEIVEEFPVTGLGKVSKKLLAQQVAAGGAR